MKTRILLILILLFSVSSLYSQEGVKRVRTTSVLIDTLISLVNQRYFISIRGNFVVAANSCDTIRVNQIQFTEKELEVVREVAKAQREQERQFRMKLKDIAEEFGIRQERPKPDSTKFTTYYLIRKNRALIGAAGGVLGLDSLRIENARHRLDSLFICYRTPEIALQDTTLLKIQAQAGNIQFPTYFTGEDTLRIFLDNPVNGWTIDELF